MSKTKKAEQLVLKKLKRSRKPAQVNELVTKHRGKLPITFALWNLRSRGEIKRVKRGYYQTV